MVDGGPLANAQEQEPAGIHLRIELMTSAVGEVTVNPPPVNRIYTSNQVVTLTAFPKAGWQFLGWDGDLQATENPASLTMDSTKSVTAIFGTSVNVLPPNHGVINANIDPARVPVESTLILTPMPDAGYFFAAWGADGTGSENPYSLVVTTTNLTISALFLPIDGPLIDSAACSLQTDGFHLVIHGKAGRTIKLLHSTDLISWQILPTETTPDGNLIFVHPLDTQAQHFYRAGY